MAQCEMCGTDSDKLVKAKIAGAELRVCGSCAELGTVLEEPETEEEDEEEESESQETVTDRTPTSVQGGRQSRSDEGEDAFDLQVEELVYDYDDRLRKAREQAGMSQEELANSVGEKTSMIQRLENGRSLPSEDVRRKLETELDIELTEAGGGRQT